MNTFFTIIFIIVALFGVTYTCIYAFSGGSTHIIIKEKWVKYHDSDAKYLVSTQGGEVFEISDSWINMRWNSSDLYAYIEPNMSCDVKYQGFRAPFFSDYKNIISANCVGGN